MFRFLSLSCHTDTADVSFTFLWVQSILRQTPSSSHLLLIIIMQKYIRQLERTSCQYTFTVNPLCYDAAPNCSMRCGNGALMIGPTCTAFTALEVHTRAGISPFPPLFVLSTEHLIPSQREIFEGEASSPELRHCAGEGNTESKLSTCLFDSSRVGSGMKRSIVR